MYQICVEITKELETVEISCESRAAVIDKRLSNEKVTTQRDTAV